MDCPPSAEATKNSVGSIIENAIVIENKTAKAFFTVSLPFDLFYVNKLNVLLVVDMQHTIIKA
jgi:hypothetical protein